MPQASREPPGNKGQKTKAYADRTADDYIDRIDPQILSSFNEKQLTEIRGAIDSAIPKPAPKIVDLRFVVDLVLTRFYVVLLVGKDRRAKPRKYIPGKMSRVGNTIAAIVLLIGLNLTISAFIFLAAYLVKSAFGIDLFPGNLRHKIEKLDGSFKPGSKSVGYSQIEGDFGVDVRQSRLPELDGQQRLSSSDARTHEV